MLSPGGRERKPAVPFRDFNPGYVGGFHPDQVVENMKALDVLEKLTSEMMDRIEAIVGNKPSPPLSFR